jgi:7-carboxy-7-deazaguanine synthase
MIMLTVCELFKSIQGESTFAGEVCSFVRLAGCNLSCSYCDTAYANKDGAGRQMSVDEVIAWVDSQHNRLVELTGGEPLIQQETAPLAARLCDESYTVLVETNGSLDISVLPDACVKVMDVKCPSSGVADSLLLSNLVALTPNDECKFVISGRADFDWACSFIATHKLTDRCSVIFSPNHEKLLAKILAKWIVETNPGARLGVQLHKCIWGDDATGH